MEQVFHNQELYHKPFQDPMGNDSHRGLENFLKKFHQPAVPTHTIITDPEYYIMLWFHNANGNLIYCPYVPIENMDEKTYVNRLTPELDFGKINKSFRASNGGIQSGAHSSGGWDRDNSGRQIYGADEETNYLNPKCIDLTPFVREAQLPDISPAGAEKITTLFGETTAGSFSPYASDGQRSITLQMLDTEFCILDALFYPWMKDINSPWWYKPSSVYTEWATPYPMATLEVQRPRMRYRLDPDQKESREDAKYVYYSYKFIGVKPTNYSSFEVNAAGRSNLMRSLTMVADMCIVDLTEDARGTQDNSANYGRHAQLIFDSNYNPPMSEEDEQETPRQISPEAQKAELDEYNEKIAKVKEELNQQKNGNQPGQEKVDWPDDDDEEIQDAKQQKDPEEEEKKEVDIDEDLPPPTREGIEKKEEEKKEETEGEGEGEGENKEEENKEESDKKDDEEKKEEENKEEEKKKEQKKEEKKENAEAEQEASKPDRKPEGEGDAEYKNGVMYYGTEDGKWEPIAARPGTSVTIGNDMYKDDGEGGWKRDFADNVPDGQGGWQRIDKAMNDKSDNTAKSAAAFQKWKDSGDEIILPGANGKMLKGKNGDWQEMQDSEVPSTWKKDEKGNWKNTDPNYNYASVWDKYASEKPAATSSTSGEGQGGGSAKGSSRMQVRSGLVREASLVNYMDNVKTSPLFQYYERKLRDSISKFHTVFDIRTDRTTYGQDSSIAIGVLNNQLLPTFSFLWDCAYKAQAGINGANEIRESTKFPTKSQIRGFAQQIGNSMQEVSTLTDRVQEMRKAWDEILLDMEFVGKVAASVMKASQTIGGKSMFVGQFGNLIGRIMADPDGKDTPIDMYVKLLREYLG